MPILFYSPANADLENTVTPVKEVGRKSQPPPITAIIIQYKNMNPTIKPITSANILNTSPAFHTSIIPYRSKIVKKNPSCTSFILELNSREEGYLSIPHIETPLWGLYGSTGAL